MNYSKPRTDVSRGVALESFKFAHPRRPNWTISYRVVAPLAMTCDVLLILLTSVLAGAVYDYDGIVGRHGYLLQCAGLAAVVAALFVTMGKSRNLYDPAELLNLKSQVRTVSIKWVGVLLFLAAAGFAMKAGGSFSRGSTLLFAFFGLAALLVERLVWRVILADGLAVRKFVGRKITLIGEEC